MPETNTTRDRIAFLRGLRAVRHFRPDPVPQEVIDDLLEIARWSGSASNRQPWELIVVRDRDMLKSISQVEGYVGHLAGAPLGIVIALTGDQERRDHETHDDGRLSERIMLAADAHGLGSCIGWPVGGGPDTVKSLLGIPADRRILAILSIGYPDEAAQRARPKPPQARKPLAEIVHEERYRS